jgi:heme/copper-type cytochrome/quinol oxidase subunit 3
MDITLVRYWNYVVSPLLIFISFFGVYVIATLKNIQVANPRLISESIRNFKRNV